ncbi:PD-(D/E)XK motif protein [Bradyrhizobium sp. 150]|uniref:PD-(D/E)XK motif protein n=1 Tax=Bradyrhizobium sp. 150 TaxID=2782625 RepID=UPI001FF8241B|nr:PD-(D/E)XK motif protein [Bradyrhizobium sp. 150]MCK1672597.1 PD-(D/E)XK motif protein [Bradyrhizobium sp. 150]
MLDPWNDIPASIDPGVDNVRRVEVAYPIDFRRGRDFFGRYIFVLEGRAQAGELPPVPKLGGIDIDTTFDASGTCRLVLTLLDRADFELFKVLCQDLLKSTSCLARGENGRGLVIVLGRLGRWQGLLRRRSEQLLSANQIIGLLGELLFLRDHVLPALGHVAINTWRGPFGDEQDFVIGGWIIEAKTQLSTADQRFHVSSEAQLDTSSGRILLLHQTIGASAENNPVSRSLNDLVEEIRGELASQDAALVGFELALVESGYRTRPEYDDSKYVLVRRMAYEIRDDFPKITPTMLMPGVEKVKYQISIEACRTFEIGIEKAMELLIGQRN